VLDLGLAQEADKSSSGGGIGLEPDI